ncbi:MAG: hypothetical protein JRH20_30905 [Deltaproteobacteria bacterium]|nr:hypothetical protein [Deltaproteobacteria bacterium]
MDSAAPLDSAAPFDSAAPLDQAVVVDSAAPLDQAVVVDSVAVIDGTALADSSTPDGGCAVLSFPTPSADQPDGEYACTVGPADVNQVFGFVVSGAGGGCSANDKPGGNGGQNSFDFIAGQTGVFRIVVGGGGALAPGNHGGPGGGASSVLFDPDSDPSRDDAFTLSIAGGGGGGALAGDPGGHGGGDGPGGEIPVEGRAPGDGTGGITTGANGGTCDTPCQGGPGGTSDGEFGFVTGGTGKGAGWGASYRFGGGGGGGYGGGGSPRYGRPGGAGAGKVFSVHAPATLTNMTETVTRGEGKGGAGGIHGVAPGEDGAVEITRH